MRKIFLILFAISMLLDVAGQVSLQTGSAVFNLPLYNWQDDKSHLTGLIQLNYNSHNGVLVDEVASNVGQGWNLVAGGVINRLQVGLPDDQMPRDGAFNDITKYAPGYLYNPTNIASGCPLALANYPIFGSQNVVYKQHNIVDADREQDYFSFQFNGRGGVFVLGKNNGDAGIALGDTKLKITFQRDEAMANTRTSITSFKIQDENGLIYTFKDKGVVKTTRMHYCNMDEYGIATVTGVPNFSADNIYHQADFDEVSWGEKPYVVTSWYLTKVEDPLTNRVIQLNYTMEDIYTPSGQNMQLIKPYAIATTRYITISHKTTIARKPVLTSIVYPDGHQANFSYGDPRVDVRGDLPLRRIQVEYQGRVLTRYDLTQSYFMRNAIGTPSTYREGVLSRLCLLSVRKTGVDLKQQEPPYVFDYYLGTNATEDCVPPLFTPLKDVWGYYDGDADGVPTDGSISTYDQYLLTFYHPMPGTLPGNDQTLKTKVKPGYAKNGLLRKVTYPLGGSLAYEYTQNLSPISAGLGNGNYYGGVHVSKVTLNDGRVGSNDIVTRYSYVLSDGTTSSLWGVEAPVTMLYPTTYFRPESNYVKVGIPPCDYGYKYAGILSTDEAVNPSDMQQFMTVFFSVLSYAGLALDIILVTTNPVFLVFDILAGIVDCVADKQYLFRHAVDYNYNLLSVNPLPAQYKRVEVYNESPAVNNGKMVYTFTSPDDYGIVAPDISNTYSSKQRTVFWAYGLPKTVTAYNAAGGMARQTENIYDFTKAMTIIDPVHASSCKCFAIKRSSKGSDIWTSPAYINAFTVNSVTNMTSDPAVQDELIVDPYTMFTGRVELQKTYDRYYKDDLHFLEKAMSYEYSPNNYQVRKVTTTLSNGDKLMKETYYTSDYTSATGIWQQMINKNIVNTPVASYNSIIKNNSSVVGYMGATVTDFGALATGDIRPSRTLTGYSALPTGTFSFDPSNPFNYSGLVQTNAFTYDGAGNLSSTIDEGSRMATMLYDYNDKYQVLSAVNAGSGEVAYTSFETDNHNGWTLHPTSGDPSFFKTGLTGGRSLDLGSVTNITSAISIGKPYILSFWTDGSVAVSGGAVLKRSAPQVGGFTYYEYAIASGSASPALSGSGHIDEVRLYPQDAAVTTSTYDPLLGKTSTCDAGSRIEYFEYDYLGRLRLVRDENKNIVKMYEYNYKNPQ